MKTKTLMFLLPSIQNVKTTSAIVMTGSSVANSVVQAVTVTTDTVAVRAFRGSDTGPLLNVDNVKLVQNVALNSDFAAGLAHTENGAVSIVCASSSKHVLLQPVDPMTKVSAPSCQITDLSAILNEFGNPYEVRMLNPDAKPTSSFLSAAVRYLIAINALLVVLLFTCSNDAVRTTRAKLD